MPKCDLDTPQGVSGIERFGNHVESSPVQKRIMNRFAIHLIGREKERSKCLSCPFLVEEGDGVFVKQMRRSNDDGILETA